MISVACGKNSWNIDRRKKLTSLCINSTKCQIYIELRMLKRFSCILIKSFDPYIVISTFLRANLFINIGYLGVWLLLARRVEPYSCSHILWLIFKLMSPCLFNLNMHFLLTSLIEWRRANFSSEGDN